MLPDALTIKALRAPKDVKLAEVLHAQRCAQKEDQVIKESFKQSIDNSIDKDVSLYQVPAVEGVKSLTKRCNPYSGVKNTKDQCEESFKRLSSAGLGNTERARGKNGKGYLIFTKVPLLHIGGNPEALDILVNLGIKFVQCEESCSDDNNLPVSQSVSSIPQSLD